MGQSLASEGWEMVVKCSLLLSFGWVILKPILFIFKGLNVIEPWGA